MNIDEILKILETRYDVILLPYQRIFLTNWLKMTKEERDKDAINRVRSFYACRRPLSLRDYWPVSLTKYCCCETKAGKHEELNKEAFDINQRRRAKGLRWSVEIK